MPEHSMITSTREPTPSVTYSSTRDCPTATSPNYGLCSSQKTWNEPRGLADERALRSADMSGRLMDLPTSTTLGNNENFSGNYHLGLGVVDMEIGDRPWLQTFDVYLQYLETDFENSPNQPAYDEVLMDLGLVDRIEIHEHRAAVTKHPHTAQTRLIIQLVAAVKRLKQYSEQSRTQGRLLKRENESIREELMAAQSMHKDQIQQLHEDNKAKIQEAAKRLAQGLEQSKIRESLVKRENERFREELKAARYEHMNQIQHLHEDNRAKIRELADHQFDLKKEVAELRAKSEEAVIKSEDPEAIRLCFEKVQERSIQTRRAHSHREASSQNETPEETEYRLAEDKFELLAERRSILALQVQMNRMQCIELQKYINATSASCNEVFGATPRVQHRLNSPPTSHLTQLNLSTPSGTELQSPTAGIPRS